MPELPYRRTNNRPISYARTKLPTLGEGGKDRTPVFVRVDKACQTARIRMGSLAAGVRVLGFNDDGARKLFTHHAEEMWRRAKSHGEKTAEREVFISNMVQRLMREYRGE